MLNRVKDFLTKLNQLGIPIPMLRDPKVGVSSVSFTMMFISFNTVLVGLIGKWSGFFGGINIEQAIYLFLICASLYFGRTLTYGSKTVNNSEEEKK